MPTPIRRRIVRIVRAIIALAVALAVILVVNTLRKGRAVVAPPPALSSAGAVPNADAIAAHLGGAIRAKTISHADPKLDDPSELATLRAFLETTYPKVHATLTRKSVGEGGLVYVWKGSDASLEPILFCAHQDVVPVEPGTEGTWKHPPFGGEIDASHVWGRGALDDKGSLVTIFEAVEALLAEGFTPKRSIYLAFGADEEVGGANGAAKIAESFAADKIHFEYALDEGNAVTEGIVPDVAAPIALIGVGEKGYLTLELSVDATPGHSSMPPPQTAVGILASAIDRLEQNPMPARLGEIERERLAILAPEFPFGRRLVLSNLWLFEPLVLSSLGKRPTSNAGIRTTTAPTIFQAGVKDNVLPSHARAAVNFRTLPGDTIADVTRHVESAIADARVKVSVADRMSHDAPPVSSSDTRAYRQIATATRRLFPNVVIVPSLTIGTTDSRWYAPVATSVYRFMPFVLTNADLPTIHGPNERFPIAGLATAVRFYEELLRDDE